MEKPEKYCARRVPPWNNPPLGASGARGRSGASWTDGAGGDDFSGDEDAISALRRCLFDEKEYDEEEAGYCCR